MKTTEQTTANDNPTPPAEQAEIQSLSIHKPTAAMRVSGIKNWPSLDVELFKLVSAWPDDFHHTIKHLYRRWARVIRKSVVGISAAPVCETAVADVLKNQIPRFPAPITDVRAFDNEGGDWRVLQLIAGLDEPTRLRLAGIFWRWAQVSDAVKCKRWNDEWERRKQLQPAAPAQQQQSVVFDLRPEYMQEIGMFRLRFFAGKNLRDDQVAWHIFRAAFLIPDQIHDAVRRVIKYSDAEGLSQDDAVRAMVIATQRPTEGEA